MVLTFVSDDQDDQAQGFSIQVTQLTDCSPFSGDIPPAFRISQAPPETGCNLIHSIGDEIHTSDIQLSGTEHVDCSYTWEKPKTEAGTKSFSDDRRDIKGY